MSDPFVAEIRIFGFNFAPKGWAFCDGQLLPISQNTALFSLVGTFYGGDGKSTFALPNLQGSAPMHTGQGQGLSERFLGEIGGSDTVTLLTSEMPAHTHSFQVSAEDATESTPQGNFLAKGLWDSGTSGGVVGTYTNAGSAVAGAFQAIGIAGGSLPHDNMQPYLTLNFCIAMQGVFPPRG